MICEIGDIVVYSVYSVRGVNRLYNLRIYMTNNSTYNFLLILIVNKENFYNISLL